MYDYLAKIILLGPSGSGKYVYLLFQPRDLCDKDKEISDGKRANK